MRIHQPMQYIEPLFRPPSEAHSLILQVTNGCSWNRCTYCEMYTAPQKKFRPKKEDDTLAEIRACGEQYAGVRRVFLADGDALVLSTRRLVTILSAIREHMPTVSRVSAYCLPSNIKKKSVEELRELRELGFTLAYVGAESGDDLLLDKINKGETFASTVDALHKLKQAGIKSSVMVINGLGGTQYAEQHALASAKLVNETQPEYLATLVLYFQQAEAQFRQRFGDDYHASDSGALFREMRSFIDATELSRTIFRSDHVSNSLILKGVLGKDKESMLAQIDHAIVNAQHMPKKTLRSM